MQDTREGEGWSRRQFSRIWGPMPSAYNLDLQSDRGEDGSEDGSQVQDQGQDSNVLSTDAKDNGSVVCEAKETEDSSVNITDGAKQLQLQSRTQQQQIPRVASLLALYRHSKMLPRISESHPIVCYVGRQQKLM